MNPCGRVPDAQNHGMGASPRLAAAVPTLVGCLDRALAKLDPRQRLVADLRTFARSPATLEEVGRRLGVSRSRVGQLEARVLRRLHSLDPDRIDAPLLRLRIGRTTPLRVADLPGLDPWFVGIDEHVGWIQGALRTLRCRHRLVDGAEGPYVTDLRGADCAALVERCRQELERRDPGGRDPGLERRLLGEILRDFMVPDLQSVVVARLDRGAGPARRAPTVAERIEEVLRAAGRPMSFAELLRELSPLQPPALSAALAKARVVRAAQGVYLAREAVADRLHLLPAVRADIVALCECEPDLQWRTADLLAAAAEAGAEWAPGLSVAAFESLLHEVPELADLGRSVWGLAAVHKERRRILDLVVAELRAHGAPMPLAELLQRAREYRRLGANWQPRYPVAQLADGRVGLADRDLGLTSSAWSRFCAELDRCLQSGEVVGPDRLVELLVRAGGPPLASRVIKSLLLARQTLSRRLRERMRNTE